MSDTETAMPITTAAPVGPVPSAAETDATFTAAPRAARAVTCVFVAEVTALPVPAVVAQRRFRACLRTDHDLLEAASAAFGDGQAVLLRAGFSGATGRVTVQVAPCYPRGPTTVIPLRWVTNGPTGEAFPAMDANLECEPADDFRGRLALRGSYRPPAGQLGAALDEVVLHRAAGVIARALLARVARLVLSAHSAVPGAPDDRRPD